ncbi:MAG: hypothetical protein QF849_00290, partial [Pseudomonadales bacterium]|nr:hypothetical protein [Pseudomonadales bacterium]
MRQFRNLVCLVALTLVVSGCSIFNWFGDDEEETRVPNDLQAISEEIQLDRLWSVNVGRGAEDKAIKLVPGLSGSRVFAAAADGSVKAMDSGSGREIWKINIESLYTKQERKIAFSDSTDTITGGVGVGEDLVLVGSAAGEV